MTYTYEELHNAVEILYPDTDADTILDNPTDAQMNLILGYLGEHSTITYRELVFA